MCRHHRTDRGRQIIYVITVVIYDLVQCGKSTIMHVWTGNGNVQQTRCFEQSPVCRITRNGTIPFISEIAIQTIVRNTAHIRIVLLSQGPTMTVETICAGCEPSDHIKIHQTIEEQRASLFIVAQQTELARKKTIESTILTHKRQQELLQGLRHVKDIGFAAKRLVKVLHISVGSSQSLGQQWQGHGHLIVRLNGLKYLLPQGALSGIPKEFSAVRQIV